MGDFNKDLIDMLPRLRRFAYSLTGAPDRADDLVQDVCERAIQRAHQFEPGTRFDSWLFAIMQSVFRNRLRSEKLRQSEGDEALAVVADPLAETAAADRAELRQTEAVIAALPEEQRLALVTVCIEGYSYKEAAALLDIPTGTLMSRLSRARLAVTKACAT